MKKTKFIVSAGLFGRLWFAYHFLFLELFILSIVDILVNTCITICVYFLYDSILERVSMLRVAAIILFFIKFIVYGFFADKLLVNSRDNIKSKKYKVIDILCKDDKTMVYRGTAVVLYLFWIMICDWTLVPNLADMILY